MPDFINRCVQAPSRIVSPGLSEREGEPTTMSSLFESLRFRAHLHNLLYDYVKRHCTVDYIVFTEGLVSEVSFSSEGLALGLMTLSRSFLGICS